MKEIHYGTKEWFEHKFSDMDELGDKWGHSFRASQKHRMQLSLNLIKDFVIKNNNLKILDIGCGTCDFLNLIYPLNKSNSLHGTDISENAIEYDKKKYPEYSLKVDSLPAVSYESATFDLIVAIEVINYLDKTGREEAMKNIKYALNSKGKLLISVVTNDSDEYFSKTEFEELVSKFFTIEKVKDNYAKIYSKLEILLLAPLYVQRIYEGRDLKEIDLLVENRIFRNFLKNKLVFNIFKLPLKILKYPILLILKSIVLVKICAWLTHKIYGSKGIEQTIILAKQNG